jgi:hypothetical protein
VLHSLWQTFSKYRVSTVFRLTKEAADAKLDPNRESFSGQIVEPAAVSAMNPPGCLLALWTDTPTASRAKNHHEPASSFDHQLIKHHFTGIWHQCSLSHRHPPETAKAYLSSIATHPFRKVSAMVHQM